MKNTTNRKVVKNMNQKTQSTVSQLLGALQGERSTLVARIAQIDGILAAARGSVVTAAKVGATTSGKRKLSPESIHKIVLAQKRRWKKFHQERDAAASATTAGAVAAATPTVTAETAAAPTVAA